MSERIRRQVVATFWSGEITVDGSRHSLYMYRVDVQQRGGGDMVTVAEGVKSGHSPLPGALVAVGYRHDPARLVTWVVEADTPLNEHDDREHDLEMARTLVAWGPSPPGDSSPVPDVTVTDAHGRQHAMRGGCAVRFASVEEFVGHYLRIVHFPLTEASMGVVEWLLTLD